MTRNLALISLVALLIVSCASPGSNQLGKSKSKRSSKHSGPIVSVGAQTDTRDSILYKRAENLYAAQRYSKAARTYLRFLSESVPSHALIDNAYFKVGMSWFELERYRDAYTYFDAVVKRYPKSEVYVEALINAGICQYHLNNLNDAAKLFKHAGEGASNPGLLSYIIFYQANISEKKSDFNGAAESFIQSERLASETDLIERSRTRLRRIFHNFFGETELIAITDRHAGKWPARAAFEELKRLYLQIDDQARLASLEEKYQSQFNSGGGIIHEVAPIGNNNYRPTRIKIGAALPLTGPSSETGRELVQGIQLAFNSFHKLIKEREIQLIIKDTGSDQDGAIRAMDELASDRDVLMILGPVFSEEFVASARLAQAHRIPVFSPSATAEGVAASSEYLFRNTITNSLEAKIMARQGVLGLGKSKFAIIYPEDQAGAELNFYFSEEVVKLGGEVVATEPYDPDQTDFGEQIKLLGGMTDNDLRTVILELAETMPDAQVEEVNVALFEQYEDSLAVPQIVSYSGELPLNEKNFRPGLVLSYEAVFLPGLYEKIALILPELEFYNLKELAKLAGRGANHGDLVKIAERYAEGIVFLDGFFSSAKSPHSKSFIRDYHLYFHSEPTILAAQAYDASRIALSSIAHGSGSRKEMTDYLQNIQFFEGVSGVTTIKQNGDADKSVFMLTVNKGKIVEYPIEGQQDEQDESPKANDTTFDETLSR